MTNNLPENDNNAQMDEFSTVFSDPVEHEKVSVAKKGKRIKIVLFAVLSVVILLGGTFAVVKLIPEKEKEKTTVDQDISVVSYDSDQIKGITVKNKNGSFNIYPKTVEEVSDEDGGPVKTTYWYLKGYDRDLTDSELISQVVNSVIDVTAIREIPGKTAKECGLDNPKITADITTDKDNKLSLLIGNQSTDNIGVYVKKSDSDMIYLVGDDIAQNLSFNDLDLASTEAQPAITLGDKYADYYEGDDLAKFDTITISGENFSEDLVLAPNKNKVFSQFVPYMVLKPMERNATGVDSLFYAFSKGFNVTGAYSYDVSKKTISSLGLDKPDFVLSAKFNDYVYTFKFKKQQDGDFAFICNDCKNVKSVSLTDCAFLSTTTADYYSETLFLVSINELKNLSFETEGKVYSFDISVNSEDSETNKYLVKCDGKTYNSSYFQSFYQYLCTLQAMDFTVDKISAKPDLTITYSYNKTKAVTKIEFFKASVTKYQYAINGVDMGKISSSSVKKITKNLQRLLEGKSITVN